MSSFIFEIKFYLLTLKWFNGILNNFSVVLNSNKSQMLCVWWGRGNYHSCDHKSACNYKIKTYHAGKKQKGGCKRNPNRGPCGKRLAVTLPHVHRKQVNLAAIIFVPSTSIYEDDNESHSC
jgi:hypothetical protein